MKGYRIESNFWCKKRITIPVDELEEGILNAYKENCDGIYIIPSAKCVQYDLRLLEMVSNSIKHLSFGEFLSIDKDNNIDGIYNLHHLKSLFLPRKYEEVDAEKINTLEVLSISLFNIRNINSLDKLYLLSINALFGKDITPLLKLPSLTELILINTNIETLSGIENINKLKKLEISYNKKLKDISSINKSNIKELKIINCKNIKNLNALKENDNLIELYCDKIDNLEFLLFMKRLKTFGFQKLDDGNLSYILKSPSIERVRFYPNKKYYTHTQDEINLLLSQKK